MKCVKCNADFEPKPYSLNKSDFRCQSCRRDYQRQWREKRIAQGLPVFGPRTWSKEKRKLYHQKRKNNPEKRQHDLATRRAYQQKPEVKRKNAVRQILKERKSAGKISNEPCAYCGEKKTEAHHQDYNQPLLILWLCADCHRKIHHREAKRSWLYYNNTNKGQKLNPIREERTTQ